MRQALVPAYSFNCSGRITQWRACVQPAEKGDTYYIQFQVWRPTGVVGCYKLVGYNAPPADVLNSRNANLSQLLEPINGCIEFSVSKNDQIKFQRGDTIGYYIDHFNPSSNNGKVQMSTSENVTIYHKRINGFSDLRSVYAIQSLGATPSNCGFVNTSVSDPDSEITSSIVGAPIISLSFGTSYNFDVS